MASEERNALAELAERLKGVHKIENCNGVPYEKITFSIDDVERASRIIAELARVPFVYNIYGARIAMVCDSAMAVERCRAIAEEGGQNG